jgi:hypothetical protein
MAGSEIEATVVLKVYAQSCCAAYRTIQYSLYKSGACSRKLKGIRVGCRCWTSERRLKRRCRQ